LPVTPGRELPLPIAVKTPQDLAFKTEVERQYLILNLMAGGRQAYEAGDFARAAHDWELLLKVPSLPPEVARVVSPLLAEAQRQRGGQPASPAPPVAPSSGGRPGGAARRRRACARGAAPDDGQRHRQRRRRDRPRRRGPVVDASGRSHAAASPFAAAARVEPVEQDVRAARARDRRRRHGGFSQRRSLLSQRVLAEPGQGFDTGLYSSGGSYEKKFTRPGPVELLCNIHASMVGYIYVVNSAYYAQPRSNARS
jgi:hypothetical protein